MTTAVPCTACHRPVRLRPVYDGGGEVFGESCARDRGLIGGRRPRPARPVRVDDPEQPSLLDQLETSNEGVMTMSDMDETEYRIEFVIQRRQRGEDDFTEIGFGSSGAWSDLDGCTHMIDSQVGNGEWETEAGYPDPSSVMADIQEAKG